jgi:ribosomal protein L18
VGPQQNAVVNGQLESAQAVGVSVAERARVRGVADDVLGADNEDSRTDGVVFT